MKTTKRSLFSSAVALFSCFAMSLGTTYAWFTDEVTSAESRIMSGSESFLSFSRARALRA